MMWRLIPYNHGGEIAPSGARSGEVKARNSGNALQT